MRAAILFLAALALAGCNTTSPQVRTRVIEVPSSAPYRYITYTDKTPDVVAKQIRRHNRAHHAVIEAEKAATANQIKP